MDGSTVPSCFGWQDKLDPSCRRCTVREACAAKQGESRPPCFCELYADDHPECMKCLDNSQCSEEHKKMATPKIRIKRAAAVAEAPVAEAELPEPEEVEEPVVVDDEDEAELDVDEEEAEPMDESPYDGLSIEELRAELNSRGLDSTGRRSVLEERLADDDAKPPAPKQASKAAPKVALKPAPAAKAPAPAAKAPAAKAAPKPTGAAKPVAVAPAAAPKPIPAPKPAPVKADEPTVAMLGTNIKEVLGAMATGMGLIIVREDKNTWSMTLVGTDAMPTSAQSKVAAPAAATGPKLRGDLFWKEVLSPEYYSWYYEDAGTGTAWSKMTAEEKAAFIESTGVEYEQTGDARVDNLRAVESLLTSLGIEKYKPEYKSSKARDAIKA